MAPRCNPLSHKLMRQDMTEFMQGTTPGGHGFRACKSCGSSLTVEPDEAEAWSAMVSTARHLSEATRTLSMGDIRLARESLYRAELLMVAAIAKADAKREALAMMRAAVSG